MSIWRKSIVTLAIAGFLGSGVLSCRLPATAGAISADGYRHATYPYGVIHQMGENLLPPVWILDNYYRDGRLIKAKEAPEYMIQFHLDTNNDGVVDEIEQGFRYDLSFVNQRTGAHIYVRTVPQSYEVANLALDVVARRFTDSLAGGDFTVVEFGFESGFIKSQVVETKRYITTMESSGPGKMAGTDAFEATIAIRNAAHAPGEAERPDQRRRVVFCRPGFSFQPKRSNKVRYPVLLIASYSAIPEKFEEGLADFERFLDAIAFNGQIGYTGPETPGSKPDSGDAGPQDPSGGVEPEQPVDDAVPAPPAAPPDAPTPPASESSPDAAPADPG